MHMLSCFTLYIVQDFCFELQEDQVFIMIVPCVWFKIVTRKMSNRTIICSPSKNTLRSLFRFHGINNSTAKAHPGGVKILQKFHNKDASKAFHSAGHSKAAYEMLKHFEIAGTNNKNDKSSSRLREQSSDDHVALNRLEQVTSKSDQPQLAVPRWRRKLFTKEDPIGFHKYLGLFCLLNFIFRFGQIYFGDPSAGLGTRLGKGPSWIPFLCLIPHGLLSVSSLMFHTIPKERVVGKPMIWLEYRAHNIIFALRSVLSAMICSLSIRFAHIPASRPLAVWAVSLLCLSSLIGADIATKKLRPNSTDSTTATTPYWEGCSIQTQKKFKTFYAYCQFMATFACLMVTNPALPLSVLLAIQVAALLLTLVRKGFLSARGFHLWYTATLIAPYFVAYRLTLFSKSLDLPILFVVASFMFMLRRMGTSKYVLWIPVIASRIMFGDMLLNYQVW